MLRSARLKDANIFIDGAQDSTFTNCHIIAAKNCVFHSCVFVDSTLDLETEQCGKNALISNCEFHKSKVLMGKFEGRS